MIAIALAGGGVARTAGTALASPAAVASAETLYCGSYYGNAPQW